MSKIINVEYTMERVMKELNFSSYEEYMELFMSRFNGSISTLDLYLLEASDKDKCIDFITKVIESRLVFISLNLKNIIDSIENDIPVIVEDFTREVALRFILEATTDEQIEDDIIDKTEKFISDNFDIKQIITNFSNIDKPKLNPMYKEEYKPEMVMKESYMFNQALISNERKEYM